MVQCAMLMFEQLKSFIYICTVFVHRCFQPLGETVAQVLRSRLAVQSWTPTVNLKDTDLNLILTVEP